MSDVIRLLPDSVANQIAAGEVIQRPASVVKELVENAVDAGAKSIQVIIKDAGRTLIQIVDDGCGMSDTDARLAFERHATSKIEQASDLFSLHTMGFRGEALASIAAVAQIDLRTRVRSSDIGTRILISGSKVESQEPEACAPGCNMMVKNLFFNVPARRKFLKKDTVEFSNIAREFERMALVNHSVELTLVHNDVTVHKLLPSSLKQRIADLFGKSLDKQLIPVATSTSIVTIDGFISRPEYARKRNALQYLTVNGRHMRHPYFHKAVMQCYAPLMASDDQPNYFLNFNVDPQTIDVNIHPTKNEIKFENEAAIWQILTAAVKESLGRFNVVPGIDFDVDDAPDIPVFNPNANGEHGVELDNSYNPFAASVPVTPPVSRRSSGVSGDSLRSTGVSSDWDKLYAGFMSSSSEKEELGSKLNVMDAKADSPELPFDDEPVVAAAPDAATIQIKNRYIMASSASGVMVIDQYRAHVKVLFERYKDMLANGDAPSQRMMFPEVVDMTPAQSDMMADIKDMVEAYGFELSYLGDNSWSIISMPSMLGTASPVSVLMRIVDDAVDGAGELSAGVSDRIALSMARSAAIRSGQQLNAEEREHLMASLLKLPMPNYTPDGLSIISVITTDDIAKLFQ